MSIERFKVTVQQLGVVLRDSGITITYMGVDPAAGYWVIRGTRHKRLEEDVRSTMREVHCRGAGATIADAMYVFLRSALDPMKIDVDSLLRGVVGTVQA